MARTEDYSATSTPKIFVAVTAALVLLRIVTSLMAMAAPPQESHPVAWIDGNVTSTIPAGKLVLYQFYANWSDPCKRMEASSLSNQQISSMIQDNFTPVRITDLSHEKGKNPQWIADVEKRYRIFALPTLVIVDHRGETVGSLIGNCSSLTTYRFLSRAIHNRTSNRVAPGQLGRTGNHIHLAANGGI